MEENLQILVPHRDAGLVRAIGTVGLAASVVNGIVGASIFTLPGAIAANTGSFAPLAYIACAIIMGAITICFAEAGSRVPTSGGAFGTVEAAFGPAAGFVTGMLLAISGMLGNGAVAAALAEMLAGFLPELPPFATRFALTLAIYALTGWVNLIGVGKTARIIAGATFLKLLPLIIFVLLGIFAGHEKLASSHANVTLGGFGRALILTVFAFMGMETALTASGEIRDPNRTVPRALFLTMGFVTALYLGVQLGAQRLLGTQLPLSAAPLADAASMVSPLARAGITLAAGISMLAYIANDLLGTPRLIFAFGRDGLLPPWFSRLTSQTRIPANAIISYLLIAFFLAVSGSFLELIILSALTTVAVYMLVCAASVVLARRNVALAGEALRFRGLPVASAIGIVGMGFMMAAAERIEILALLGVIAVSLAIFAVMRRGVLR